MILVDGNVGLLLTLGSDEGIDFLDIDFVQFLASSLDHGLVGLLGDNENKGVVIFDVLNSRLGGERVLDEGELIESVLFLDSSKDVLGVSLLGEGLRESESNLGPYLSLSGGMGSLLNGGGGLLGSSSSDLKIIINECLLNIPSWALLLIQ